MQLGGSPLPDHIIIGIISSQPDFIIISVDIPVTSIKHGIIRLHNTSPFFLPFNSFLIAFAGDLPECAGNGVTDSFSGQ